MSEDEPKKSSNIKLYWIRRWDNILQTLAIKHGASIPGNLSEDEQKKLPNIKSYSRYPTINEGVPVWLNESKKV